MSFKIGFGLGAGIMVGMIGGMVLAGACAAAGFGGYLAVKNKLGKLKKKEGERGMKIAANFVIGGIVFTGLIVGGMILGSIATYGLLEDEILAGKEAIASRRLREEYQKKARGRYAWGSEQHNTDESEETAE